MMWQCYTQNMHAMHPHSKHHGARTYVRRSLGGNVSATTFRAPLQPPPTRWSWLHATAYSSVIVVCVAYVHSEAAAFFATRDYVLPVASTTSLPSPPPDRLVRSTRLHQYALVAAVVCAWFAALVASQRMHLHAPLKRIGTHVRNAVRRMRHLRTACGSPQTHLHERRDSWGYFGVDHEIDDLDTLVLTSLSPERNVVVPYASTTRSRRATIRTATVVNNNNSANQIVLSPRVGARGGRHDTNQIVSDDPFVSRYHFQILYDGMEKEYFLEDLGSTTGTFLYIKPQLPKRLRVNDRIKVGDTEFEVVAIDKNVATGTPFLRVCFTEGPLAGIAQTIGKTAVTLGRRSSNALCITDDSSISGRHSVLEYLGDGFYITDLSSTNGTAMRLSASGEKSARRYLRHGDVFGVGSNRFLVEYAHQLDAERGEDAFAHPRAD